MNDHFIFLYAGYYMWPIADFSSYSFMCMVCAVLGEVMIIFAYDRRKIFVG
ncbi:hypothetical protein [Metabacillus fastidiosus]|uniref:hypothetical protein n=1 Tax=Metabacillus fastidiosus TaxID=1458 RepID=UPI003D2E2DAE